MRAEQSAHIDELFRVAGGAASPRDAIIRKSWWRCVAEHKLDPASLREACIVTQERLHEHQDALDAFLHTARFGVEALYRQVAGLGYVLLLTDADGVTVDFIGDPTFNDTLRRAGLYLGADWNEHHAGTCAVGTCIAAGEALIVHQTDHFDATHIPLTCTAAPVFDASGRLAAVLDISALRSPEAKESQFLALQLVKSYAHKIEVAHLLSRFRERWIVKLSASLEFADVDPDFVLAVDEQGRIAGFNNRARLLLGPAAGAGASLLGSRLDAILDVAVEDLPRLVHSRPAALRAIRVLATGATLFAQSLAPPAQRVARAPASARTELPASLQALFDGDALMAEVARRAARLADIRMSLLIQGETGSGKEHLAKALHAASARASKPFVPVNCAALPETLIEAELFGYEAGAFTGAAARGRKGLVLEADGGTLFLDEIGDMPLSSQTRLLRVLAEREVTPVGRTRPVAVDIRVIAATHRDLAEEVRRGRFREDLYFRLNAAVLSLPALRQRADLEWLIGRLLAERADLAEGPEHCWRLSPAALDALRVHPWPGNIRELVNALDYACAVATGGFIRGDDLPDAVRRAGVERHAFAAAGPVVSLPPAQALADQALRLERALADHRWNVSSVARELGLDRTTIHRQMRRFGIVPPHRRGTDAGHDV